MMKDDILLVGYQFNCLWIYRRFSRKTFLEDPFEEIREVQIDDEQFFSQNIEDLWFFFAQTIHKFFLMFCKA